MKIVIIFLCLFLMGNVQTLDGVVTSIDSDFVVIDTVDGNGWVVDYEDSYSLLDSVIITFNDKGTKSIYDDEIISLKKR